MTEKSSLRILLSSLILTLTISFCHNSVGAAGEHTDWMIVEHWMTPSSPKTGEAVTFYITVRINQLIDPLPQTLQVVLILDGSQYTSGSLTFTNPKGTLTTHASWTATPGLHQIKWILDPNMMYNDPNIVNNQALLSFEAGDMADKDNYCYPPILRISLDKEIVEPPGQVTLKGIVLCPKTLQGLLDLPVMIMVDTPKGPHPKNPQFAVTDASGTFVFIFHVTEKTTIGRYYVAAIAEGTEAIGTFEVRLPESQTYSVTIHIRGFSSELQTNIVVDGEKPGEISGNSSKEYTFPLGSTHVIEVDEYVEKEEGARYYCKSRRAEFSEEGSYVFNYIDEYFVTISVEPPITSIAGSGWYPTGSTINLIAPTPIEGTSGTQYRFSRWQFDSSSLTEKTIKIDVDKPHNIFARYDTYFLLTVESEYGETAGGGWYKEGEPVIISAPSEVPMEGIWGLLGGKVRCQGWRGDLELSEPAFSITMDEPYQVEAVWSADYTIPTIMSVAGLALLVGILGVIARLLGLGVGLIIPKGFTDALEKFNEAEKKYNDAKEKMERAGGYHKAPQELQEKISEAAKELKEAAEERSKEADKWYRETLEKHKSGENVDKELTDSYKETLDGKKSLERSQEALEELEKLKKPPPPEAPPQAPPEAPPKPPTKPPTPEPTPRAPPPETPAGEPPPITPTKPEEECKEWNEICVRFFVIDELGGRRKTRGKEGLLKGAQYGKEKDGRETNFGKLTKESETILLMTLEDVNMIWRKCCIRFLCDRCEPNGYSIHAMDLQGLPSSIVLPDKYHLPPLGIRPFKNGEFIDEARYRQIWKVSDLSGVLDRPERSNEFCKRSITLPKSLEAKVREEWAETLKVDGYSKESKGKVEEGKLISEKDDNAAVSALLEAAVDEKFGEKCINIFIVEKHDNKETTIDEAGYALEPGTFALVEEGSVKPKCNLLAHELGHCLGLNHDSARGKKENLMYPGGGRELTKKGEEAEGQSQCEKVEETKKMARESFPRLRKALSK